MYSQCPDCLTRFRVTAEVLRVAQGTVRCGRCGSAFNALVRLSDTPPPPGPAVDLAPLRAAAPLVATGAGQPSPDFHFSADDLDQVFVDARDWQRKFPDAGATGPNDALAEIPPSETSVLEVDESAPLEDITLEGERIQIEVPPGFLDDEEVELEAAAPARHEVESDLDSTDEFEVVDEREIAALADRILQEDRSLPGSSAGDAREGTVNFRMTDDLRAQLAAAAGVVAPSSRSAPSPAPIVAEPARKPVESIAPRRWQAPSSASEDELLPLGRGADETTDEPEASSHRLAWGLGSLVLALALVAQLTHYFRQDLVRHPQLGPTLTSIYDALGLDLAPNWDPRAFEIRQWGGAGNNAKDGRLNVQASIRNTAAFAQPYPLLRLELEDRFGGTVATRDFEPAEYLKSPAQGSRLLAPGGSADADLQIVDPGSDAVGYRLNVCLRESAEILRCAQGPG